MAIQPTYPGVYVQEIPSGVRTIAGVSTSVALFIGRAARGPLNQPVLCLNFSDFERVFSNDATYGEMPRALRLFFQNGGTQCYVVRIAQGASAATVTLHNEAGNPTLLATAQAAGASGDDVRMAVSYSGSQPEGTFDLEVFRWGTSSSGQQQKEAQEIWQGLSMDPASPRYAPAYVTQQSSLIELTDLTPGGTPPATSTTTASRPTPDSVPDLVDTWQAIVETGIGAVRVSDTWNGTSTITAGGAFTGNNSKQFTFTIQGVGAADLEVGTDNIDINWNDGSNQGTINLTNAYSAGDSIAVNEGLEIFLAAGDLREGEVFFAYAHPPAYQFRLSANGGQSWTNISLQGRIDFGAIGSDADLVNAIQAVVDEAFTVGTVIVSFVAGPGANTQLVQFSAPAGDVRVEPATSNDLATILLLGSAQGGVEVSGYAERRPAASGLVYDLSNWNALAALTQDDFDTVTIGGEAIDLADQLVTVASTSPMYEDGMSPSPSAGMDGMREKLAVIANAVNSYRLATPGFTWSASVSGNRLVIMPTSGADNLQGSIATSNSGGGGTDITGQFRSNTRYYSLGLGGLGGFQSAGSAGNDGTAPGLTDLQDAFEVVEREVDLFNLLILPQDADHDAATVASFWGPASIFCQQQRAFLLMDAPDGWENVQQATHPSTGVNSLRIGLVKDHSAIFYPNLLIREDGLNVPVGPSGAIAGLMARIDSNRGVWKAPAGTEADIRDVVGLTRRFSNQENGVLNPVGINTLRVFPNGIVNWGARTMDGANDFGSEWKYIPIRRLALFMEESLYRGLQWVVFEPNDEALWAQIRLNVGAFMNNLFRQGAFQGTKKSDAYFVKCDSETNPQNDVDQGIVNIWIGFAPLKPAEFVILKLQQMAGQIEV
ncbi:MAG: phage tail sheath subtilisin-like domain-containing protein [Bacteroidota bacterium]